MPRKGFARSSEGFGARAWLVFSCVYTIPMSIHVALRHTTHYTYDREVTLGPQQVRLRPAPHCRTPILAYSLKVEPAEHFLNWQQDPQSNYVGRLTFPKPTRAFKVVVDLVAEMAVYNPFDFFIEESAAHYPFQYDPLLQHELEAFHRVLPVTPRFAVFIASLRSSYTRLKTEPVRTIDVLVGLNQRIAQEIGYLIRLEPGVQTPEQTLESKSGSCRDSAWLLCQVFRHLGLASRFVSGYIVQLKADQEALDGPSGASADFTDLHAWCEVFIPGAGWIGLDATSGLLAGEGHIPLACTPDPTSAAPITGALSAANTEFHFEMTVTRIFESPRVAKPYTPQQFEAMDALGKRIDEDMKELDMRLTVGGEPTFISIDDPEGPEWNVTAQSPRKRVLSGELLKRLQAHFGAGGLLHYGQGKWYPGEVLPRYALGCFWRRDGQPMWVNPALVADEAKDYGHGLAEARQFADKLMETLRVDPRWLLPAYEDAEYYEWKQRRLPSNVDVKNPQLPNKQESERVARLSGEKLAEVVGWVLPDPSRGEALALVALVPARQQALADPGRFAGRLSPAARVAAVGQAGGLSVHHSARSFRAARAAPAAARPGARAPPGGDAARRSSTRGRRIRRQDRPHRAHRGGAARPRAYLHAARGGARRLP